MKEATIGIRNLVDLPKRLILNSLNNCFSSEICAYKIECPDSTTLSEIKSNVQLLIMETPNLVETDKVPKSVVTQTNIAVEPSLKSDISHTTQSLLEDVCNDFESIDVITPKAKLTLNSPLGKLKNFSRAGLQHPIRAVRSTSNKNDQGCKPTTSLKPAAVNEVNSNQVDSESTSVLSTDHILSSSDATGSSDLKGCSAFSNITLVADDSNKLISSSLAELADAELVQTGDNSVSVVITNPRLIKVNTSQKTADGSTAPEPEKIIELVDKSVPEDSEQSEVLENTHNSDIEHITFVYSQSSNDSEKNCESVPDDMDGSSEQEDCNISPIKPKHSSTSTLKRVFYNKTKNKVSYKANSDAGKITKARRITAKMKAQWSEELESTGHLTCPIQGCFQTYVTFANFQTHYKWCTGKKNLQHCPYCDSLIFSSQKAILHHMEVEHPDKIEEYKEKYPIAPELESQSSISVKSDDDRTVGREMNQKPIKNIKKRKFSSKENILCPKKTILKHKMKSLNETALQNIKEFKKCVRFDDIVQKINSVSDVTKAVVIQGAADLKFFKNKKKKLILTESIVDEDKFFVETDDFNPSTDTESEVEFGGRINTKSKLVLNMERYKRYNEYLKLTRDWASERKTYSRNRNSESSFDSPLKGSSAAECIQDTHQLSDNPESMHISLSTQESQADGEISTEIPDFDALDSCLYIDNPESSNRFIKAVEKQKNVLSLSQTLEISANDVTENLYRDNQNEQPVINQSSITENIVPQIYEKRPVMHIRPAVRSRVTCYDRANQMSTPIKPDSPRKLPTFVDSPITYGVKLPESPEPQAPTVDFDTLIKSCPVVEKLWNKWVPVKENVKRKRGRPPKIREAEKVDITPEIDTSIAKSIAKTVPSSKNKVKYCKQDGVKLPATSVPDIITKRKRGRPRKIPIDPNVAAASSSTNNTPEKPTKITKRQIKPINRDFPSTKKSIK